jgi:hypothetical protein
MKYTLYISSFGNFSQNRNANCMELFEDFLLFDCVSFNIVGINNPILFLINELGLNKVEELLERGTIEFVTNVPLIATNLGKELNGKQQYKGVQPLFTGKIKNQSNSDPEYQVDEALKLITGLNRERRRIFKKIVLNQYKIPNSTFSSDAKTLVLNAYKSNKLKSLGLDYNREPEDLGIKERHLLVNLGYEIIETSILAQFNYKSKNNSKVLLIVKESIDKLLNAGQVLVNNSEILRIENIPDLQNLYLVKNYKFSDVFSIRDSGDAKKYRRWINEKTNELKDKSITKDYIDSITKQNGFFNTNKGKLLKTISMFAFSSYVGKEISDTSGSLIGLSLGKVLDRATDLGIDLIDEYILEGILKGWNPRFFVDELKEKIMKP